MINSIVGETTSLKGDFEIDGTLRIDGNFQGTVKGKTNVLIGEKGSAHFNLNAEQITIGGYVEGSIEVSGKIILLSTGTLKGSIKAENLIVEPGATLSISCVTT